MLMVSLRGEKATESHNGDAGSMRRHQATRGPIKAWSRRSASRLRDYLHGCRAAYSVLLTLTYPWWTAGGHDYDCAKRDLRVFFQRYNREFKGVEGRSAVWVMEHTKVGTIHFHILTNHFLPYGWAAKAWYEVCGTEDPRHLQAGIRVEALKDREAGCRYMAKYLSKQSMERQTLESGGHCGRWWGVVGGRAELTAVLRVKDERAGPGTEERVKEQVHSLMGTLVSQGKATEVDLTSCEDVPTGTRMWRIPSYEERVSVAGFIARLKWDMACHGVSDEEFIAELDEDWLGGLP